MVELMCLLAVLAALMLSFVYLAKIDNDYKKEHNDSLYSH